MAKDGITNLGGKEFDEIIGELILRQLKSVQKKQLVLNGRALRQLIKLSEDLKIELCTPGKNYVKRSVVLANLGFKVNITRPQFNKALLPFLEQTEKICERCLGSAGLTHRDIDLLLLVGGSSMVPLIKDRMKVLFNLPHQEVLFHEPIKAVAFGAVLHAHQLKGDSDKFNMPPEFKGVTGYFIGVQTIDFQTFSLKIEVLIKKNMPLPVSVSKTFYTNREHQNQIVLKMVQYIESPDDARSIGQLIIGPLPNLNKGHPFKVTIEAKADGTINVHAQNVWNGTNIQQGFRSEESIAEYLPLQKKLVKSLSINYAPSLKIF